MLKRIKESLALQIALAMLLGIAAGLAFGPRIAPIGEIGRKIIEVIKAIAIPLVFFAIIEAILSTSIKGRDGFLMIMIVMIDAVFAAAIGLTIVNLIHPGTWLSSAMMSTLGSAPAADPIKKLNIIDAFLGHIPSSFFEPFVTGDVLAVVIIALLLGFAARSELLHPTSREHSAWLIRAVDTGYKILRRVIGWIVHLVPLAVFAVTCKTVGEQGLDPFVGLSVYVLVILLGLLLHIAIVYSFWIKVVAHIPLNKFYRESKEALIYSIGTNSSLATLPLTLDTLDRLKVSKSSSRLGACIGTNFNNDGILLYEAMAVILIAQALGIEMSLVDQISAVALAAVAAMGIAGVPEAGVVSLSLVLSAVGLPLSVVPLLLTVDWVVARARSFTNVMSDLTVSIAIDALKDKESKQQNSYSS